MIRIPRAAALSRFDPGDSPTTRQVVRLETESAVSPPRRFDPPAGLVAAETLERPGDDEDLARRAGPRGPAFPPADRVDPRLLEPGDELPVLGLGEEEDDALGDPGPDILDGDEVFGRGLRELPEGPEPPGEALGEAFADVADPQGEDEAGEAPASSRPRSVR